ncbi:hypothetical protein ACFY8P_23335 [Streptomyces sp. NPDC012693]|jgi:hypothetical protein|uniref:hypothetical protein n=1 Tax=unclassified Streptomyces TaxID=2593676 RepID=UPI00202E8516|nr:hypothetical protein [Streptomyces sp. MSC1_001]
MISIKGRGSDMGFYSGWSNGRGFYGGYRVRLSGGARRSTATRPSPSRPGTHPAGDVPEWVELSYFLTAAVVFCLGMLSAAVWLWIETDGSVDSLPVRLTLIVLLLIPAVIASAIAAIAAGFLAPILVGLVKAAIAVTRWIRRRRAVVQE